MNIAQQGNRSSFGSPFAFGDRVHLDADKDLVAVVTGFCWADQDGHTVQASWIHNGTAQVAWFQPWRLNHAESAVPTR